MENAAVNTSASHSSTSESPASERSATKSLTSAPPAVDNIDNLFQQTHDEYARSRYVATLHNHALMRVRFDVKDVYEAAVRPAFEQEKGRPPETGHEISKAIKKNLFYRTYSSFRYNAQEMLSQAKQSAVQRKLPEMIAAVKKIANENPTGGTLRTNPNLEIPRYITAQDVHLIPGGYHSEFTEDDVAQGFLTGVKPGPMVNRGRDFGSVGYSIGAWIKHAYPDFKPASMLDMGTQGGSNLIAYSTVFPDTELYGIDIAAPSLRYGHAKAEQMGVKMHLSQQNAEKIDFEDESFDLVVTSFFFHEIAVPASKRILKEALRVLKPGGLMVNLELPPHKSCEPFLNFMFDWDTNHNNEPNYRRYRSQDPTQLMIEAGFPEVETFERVVPEMAVIPKDDCIAMWDGKMEPPLHGRGGWYIYGSRKA
ncbi:MAG: class I SAM-dependent methyltransferase [Rhodospirillaceae bacterium]